MERLIRVRQYLNESGLKGFIFDQVVDLKYLSKGKIFSGKLIVSSEEVRLFITPMDVAMYSYLTSEGIEITCCSSFSDDSLLGYLQNMENCGFDPATVTYTSYQRILSHCPSPKPVPCFLDRIRSIKSSEELEKMTAAAKLGSEGYDLVYSLLNENVTAEGLATELRAFWASRGAGATAFPPIIAFGEDTAFPHASLSKRKLCFGDIVLIDIGVELDGYCSDMTRVLNWGEPKEELREIYRIVRKAQIEGLKLCKAGISCEEIHKVVCAVVKEAGYEKQFMHGTGHGIGMSVHEYPFLSSHQQEGRMTEILLKESMVVTVEPGIYLSGIGGVRLENSIIINSDSYTDLTKRETPEELPCLY